MVEMRRNLIALLTLLLLTLPVHGQQPANRLRFGPTTVGVTCNPATGDVFTLSVAPFTVYRCTATDIWTPVGIADHGALTGLSDDDHPQYLTEAEGDALYEPLGAASSLDELSDVAVSSPATGHALVFDGSLFVNRVLVKGDVGLGSVDNTSDAAKPVSTATQAALDAKQPLNANLTTIAGLSPSANDVMQFVGGVWANRTTAQLKASLGLVQADIVGLTTGSSPTFAGLTLKGAGTTTGVTLKTTDSADVERLVVLDNGTVRMGIATSANYASNNNTFTIRHGGASGAAPNATLGVENNGSNNGAFAFQISTAGRTNSFQVSNAGNVGVGTTSIGAQLHVVAGAAGTKGLMAASPSANPFEVQDSTGAAVVKVNQLGALVVTGGGNANVQTEFLTDATNSVAYLKTSQGSNYAWLLTNRTATNVLFSLRGAASQSANLQEWQNSSGTPLASVNASGALFAPKYCYTATVCDWAGAGTPEGTVTAAVGSTYRRTDGGASTTFYVKESGAGNTGWIAK
jgi:hypothetical protein